MRSFQDFQLVYYERYDNQHDAMSREYDLKQLSHAEKEQLIGNKMKKYSGVLLKAGDGKIILQQRENKPGIANPGMIAIFGGSAEDDETPIQCAMRELREEVELVVQSKDLTQLGMYHIDVPNVGPVESHIFMVENVDMRQLTLKEGESFFVLDPSTDMKELNFAPVCRMVLRDMYGSNKV